MGAWMWGGDGIHSPGSIRAKGAGGLTLGTGSQSEGFKRKVLLSALWLTQWGKGPGCLRVSSSLNSTLPQRSSDSKGVGTCSSRAHLGVGDERV